MSTYNVLARAHHSIFLTEYIIKCGAELDLNNCDDPQWAAGTFDDLERRGNDDSAGRGQQVQVHEAGDAKAARPMHVGVAGERRIEAACLARIGADGLNAYSQDIPLFRQEGGAGGVKTRGVRAIVVDI